MRITNNRKRKAISPVLATVILIAITLIAAIAIAGFVFGLFGTFTTGPNLGLALTSCTHGALGNVAGSGYCTLKLTNTGGASASVTGCTLYGATGVSGLTAAPPVVASVVTVTAGTTSSNPTAVTCSGAAVALVTGAAVTGTLIVASGSPIAFSAIAA